MVLGLNFSQKTSGVHPVKFFEKDSRAYLTGADLTGELSAICPPREIAKHRLCNNLISLGS